MAIRYVELLLECCPQHLLTDAAKWNDTKTHIKNASKE